MLTEDTNTATKIEDEVSLLVLRKQKSYTAARIFPPQLLRALVNMVSMESTRALMDRDTLSFSVSDSGTWLRLIASVLHLSPANSDATVDSWSRNEINRLENQLKRIYLAHKSDNRSLGGGYICISFFSSGNDVGVCKFRVYDACDGVRS